MLIWFSGKASTNWNTSGLCYSKSISRRNMKKRHKGLLLAVVGAVLLVTFGVLSSIYVGGGGRPIKHPHPLLSEIEPLPLTYLHFFGSIILMVVGLGTVVWCSIKGENTP
ncbi:hypothetical protein AKJ61_02365 [candidate division MSBL1 archaeon SCGC-AAA259B11]|uniref:Uncharacterized protein n=1 Tax=candidate division MSBL1 archaeon SCGC-AAA259B11 TaxID=1698260 RepID=A0A133U673_9EURY|nr:hypothetical protein AKJ61_02365 [candidate division MSBL1 archaeon SCGC-AAA259B11]